MKLQCLNGQHPNVLNDIGKLILTHGRLDQDIASENFRDPRIKDLNSLHDVLYEYKRANQRERNEKDFDVIQEMSGLGKDLHEYQLSDTHKLIIAQTKRDLVEWGNTMHNCIGGYTYRLGHKSTILGAVYEHNTLCANFEIDNIPQRQPRLRQLLGKYNHTLESDLKEKTEQVFKEKGIEVGQYWG